MTIRPTTTAVRRAAELLWGDAGTYAVDTFERLNAEHFDGELPPIPIAIGLTGYGRCIGFTRDRVEWLARPRITLHPRLFQESGMGLRMVDDTLLHEMIHARLMLSGDDSAHNAAPWCAELGRLSPVVLGHAVDARPVRPQRVPNPDREHDPSAPKTIVRRVVAPGALTRDELAHWPQSLRPVGYFDDDDHLPVPNY